MTNATKGRIAPGPRRRFSEAQVAAALRATGGIYSHAAVWLHEKTHRRCSRQAVANYVAGSPKLQRLLAVIDEIFLDDAEARLRAFIVSGSERALFYYLSTKGKNRGYTRRHQVVDADDKPIAPMPDRPNLLKHLSLETLLRMRAELVEAAAEEEQLASAIDGRVLEHNHSASWSVAE